MSKTKRLYTLEELFERIETTLSNIDDIKRRGLVVNWIGDFCHYLNQEKNFNPQKLMKYYPGDVIEADFGFNICRELGGPHFAVVMETSSRKSSNVMVVPLSSYTDKSVIKQYHVDLGVIPELNNKRGHGVHKGTRALPEQMRVISKMRIYSPKSNKQHFYRLPSDILQKIYDKVYSQYCSQHFTKTE